MTIKRKVVRREYGFLDQSCWKLENKGCKVLLIEPLGKEGAIINYRKRTALEQKAYNNRPKIKLLKLKF